MVLEIDLNERLFKNILNYCEVNNLDVNDYVASIISNGFYTDTWGDMNQMLNKPTEVVEEKKQDIIQEKENKLSATIIEKVPQDENNVSQPKTNVRKKRQLSAK